jgi:hypothetical protein
MLRNETAAVTIVRDVMSPTESQMQNSDGKEPGQTHTRAHAHAHTLRHIDTCTRWHLYRKGGCAIECVRAKTGHEPPPNMSAHIYQPSALLCFTGLRKAILADSHIYISLSSLSLVSLNLLRMHTCPCRCCAPFDTIKTVDVRAPRIPHLCRAILPQSISDHMKAGKLANGRSLHI